MRRALSVLVAVLASAVLLAALHPAHAGFPVVDVFVIGTGGNCTTTTCSSGIHVMCRNSGTATTAYLCNSSTLKYDIPISGGGGTFDTVGSGTNTSSAMTVGSGATLGPGGTGVIQATQLLGSGSTTGAVDLATAEVGGTLPVVRGGTGNAIYSSGRCLITTGATTISTDGGCLYDATTDTLTIGAAVAVTAGPVSVASGQKVNLEGAAGDSYLTRDPDTGYVLVYIDAALRGAITPRGLIPGACGTDLWASETGTVCTDSLGRRVFVGPDGPAVLTGSAP